jgi:zinc transport system substrate-binding protein
VPFEESWIDRIRQNNPNLDIEDLRDGIQLIPMITYEEVVRSAGDGRAMPGPVPGGSSSGRDPHTWLSPALVKIQAGVICDALVSRDPAHESEYRANLRSFEEDLDRLSGDIQAVFESVPTRMFLVYHPAWEYFAREFGLIQIPVEIEGKEPSPRELAGIIGTVREHGIRTVFVQPQNTGPGVLAVAESIDGTVVAIDPLAADYPDNLRHVAVELRKAMLVSP